MPTKKTGTTPANQQKGKKVCSCCHNEKNLTEFYLSYSPMYSLDKRIPVCKDCCKTSVLNEDGTINYPKFKSLLMQTDKPLYYDLLASSEESILNESGYLDKDALKYRGKEILQKYFTLIVMRQDRQRSWADAEAEGHLHQNNNRTVAEKSAIISKYSPLFNNDTINFSIMNPQNSQLQQSKSEVKWSKKDKQNMKYVTSMIGYDPFDDVGLDDYDRKYCFNILAGYCDTDGIVDDGHKMQSVIEMTMLYCQCRRITEQMNIELSKSEVDDVKVQKLTTSKTSLLSSIATIAKDNNIASNYNKNSKQGKSSLSSKMKEMEENDFEAIKVNLFDIKQAEAFKQIADLSNRSIMDQLTFDSSDYSEIVNEQRELIQKYETELDTYKEENRILKNKLIDLENVKKR